MARGGNILAWVVVSLCVVAGASAFPFTSPGGQSARSPVTLPAPPTANFPAVPAGGQGGGGGGAQGGGGKVWCIAKPAADEETLMGNIAFACEEGGLNCAAIQPGGACFSPTNVISHSSYVMNMYYQKNQRNWWTCHFNNTGLVVFADPSFGDCVYSPQ